MLNPASRKWSSSCAVAASSTVQPKTFPPSTSGAIFNSELPSLCRSMDFPVISPSLKYAVLHLVALGAGLDTKFECCTYFATDRKEHESRIHRFGEHGLADGGQPYQSRTRGHGLQPNPREGRAVDRSGGAVCCTHRGRLPGRGRDHHAG